MIPQINDTQEIPPARYRHHIALRETRGDTQVITRLYVANGSSFEVLGEYLKQQNAILCTGIKTNARAELSVAANGKLGI